MKALRIKQVLLWCLLAPVMFSCDRGSDVQPIDSARKSLRVAATLNSSSSIDQYCPSNGAQWERILCLDPGEFHNSVKSDMIITCIDGINAARLGTNPDVCYDRSTGNLIFKSTVSGNNRTYVSDVSKNIFSECENPPIERPSYPH